MTIKSRHTSSPSHLAHNLRGKLTVLNNPQHLLPNPIFQVAQVMSHIDQGTWNLLWFLYGALGPAEANIRTVSPMAIGDL